MNDASRQYRLDQLSVPRLFFALLRSRFTGTLTLPQPVPEPGQRTVWFRGGMPIFTDWVSHADVLGEVLLNKAMASSGAIQQGLITMAQQGGLLGQVLVNAGALDDRSLAEALRVQCLRKLVHAFALRAGVANLDAVEHAKGVGGELSGQVNVLQLILAGVTRHYDEARVRGELGDALHSHIATSPAFAKYKGQFGFREEDLVIIQQLQRGTTLAELAVPGLSRKRIVQLVFVAWACQMLLAGDEVSAAPASAAATTPLAPTAASPPTPPPPPRVSEEAARPSVARSAPPPDRSEEPKKIPKQLIQEAPSGAADIAFEAEVAAFEAKIGGNPHAFALFDLKLDADRKQIRARWSELSGRFHPDRLESEGLGRLRQRVEAVFASLSEANGVLSNQEERENLKRVIESGVDPSQPGQDVRTVVRNALEAEMLARDADKLLKKGSFARALELYDKARALHADEAEIEAAAAWCRYQVDDRTPTAAQTALEILARTVEEQPMCARAHYYRGLVLLQTNQEDLAKVSFAQALKADAHYTDAERQLRAIKLNKKAALEQHGQDAKKKGGLRGLFGRKD